MIHPLFLRTKKARGRFLFCVIVVPVIVLWTVILLVLEPWLTVAITWALCVGIMLLLKLFIFIGHWIERGDDE